MKLKNWTDAERGKQAWLAREVGVSLPTMTRWVNEQDEIPENRCRQIEKATNGAVTCEEMRPDLAADFEYMRKRAAPELAGAAVLLPGDALGYVGAEVKHG